MRRRSGLLPADKILEARARRQVFNSVRLRRRIVVDRKAPGMVAGVALWHSEESS